MQTLESVDLREGFADLGGVRLHYVEAGEGPLVVLLHGFPEFWWSWRAQVPALVEAGFRVVAPDMRGYNTSSKPAKVADYALETLAADIRDLIRERGEERALLAGHDWGAVVAWAVAMYHPEVVERLAILNVPHPRRMLAGLRTLRQLRRSWYIAFFQLPLVPERLASLRDFAALKRPFGDARPGAFTDEDLRRYSEAWSQPGALTAMLAYYRATTRRTPKQSLAALRPVTAPTRVIWGEQDRHLGAELAEPLRKDVPNLERVVRLPQASHWVQHDEPDRVNELLVEFFRG